jgi:hypothetical protein
MKTKRTGKRGKGAEKGKKGRKESCRDKIDRQRAEGQRKGTDSGRVTS